MNNLIDFTYHHVLVLGLAKSGTAAAKLLIKNGVKVRINDLNAKKTDAHVLELESLGAEVVVGSHPLTCLSQIDLIVKNPGIPYTNPIILEAEKRNIDVITEVELAGRVIQQPIIGVTGSNGKTTTTTLITEMLKSSNQKIKTAGNIGTAVSDIAEQLEEDDTVLLELSSFQLLGIQMFKPHTAVLLNIYEAHLDYHQTFENYKQAKCNIFINQTKDDFLVYNADDPIVSEEAEKSGATLVPFSTKKRLITGSWSDDHYIYYNSDPVMALEDIALVGEHNLQNILAAICASMLNGATFEGIRQVLLTFSGVKHRLQLVERINDRLFYNDSKATNILATQKALVSFKQPTILLAGGLDRGNEFDELIPYLLNVKALIVFGQTQDKLAAIGDRAGINIIEKVADVEEAVRVAYRVSNARDVILLSPACASWDQYETFEQRGDMFIQAVHTLE